jgi:N-acetylglutamate synthase-like GNAT family acetyltransferase
MLKLSIRNAQINDINSIKEILDKSFEPYKKKYTKDAYNTTVLSCDELKKRIIRSDFRVLVITFKYQIVGTTSISMKNDKILNIRSMAVLQKFQNRGIGTYILNEICRIA